MHAEMLSISTVDSHTDFAVILTITTKMPSAIQVTSIKNR